ncbi:MAG TPA: tetratricopeptide repeat protein, partial [Planctomycetes bacterium]|nr:tetratricopeptide repeat protein [Planctomycetota bacterium]
MKRAALATIVLLAAAGARAGEAAGLKERVAGEFIALDALMLLREGKAGEALELFEKARSRDDGNPYISYNVAAAASAAGDAGRAVSEVRRALRDIPDDALRSNPEMKKLATAGWHNLGVLLARSGNLDESLSAFRRSLEILPGDPDTAFNHELVRRLIEQRKKMEEEQKQKSEELQKKLEEIARRIAELVIEQGRTLASLWRARPELMPKPPLEPDDDGEPAGGGLMGLGKSIRNMLQSAAGKGSGAAPALRLDEEMSPFDVADWVREMFAPQPALPDDELAAAEGIIGDKARSIAGEVAAVAEELSGGADGDGQQYVNPLAEGLGRSALHLGAGAVHAETAAGAVEKSNHHEAAVRMTLAEREFLLALAPFIQPPQQQRQNQQDG